ncbi:fimbrial major subunit CsuA/B family protein [Sphingomonas sp. AP4-R1]|uniref:Csu type fimbrial protein n=1 Tax=Sphingomonas sp. AP4-R1 TaxID=2735134 RepID=UPI0014933D2F|nr:spore coat protein U domain-containing protein [Sphingomonas sp. AP4-R1]QJU56988.1 fimbrial major subunit CsuA/B family protein [Sphingomonas sp. AP4-R1]
MIRWAVAVPLGLVAWSQPWPPARAASSTERLPVSARILPSCDIGGSATGGLRRGTIDFGARAMSGGETVLIAGDLPIRCSEGASVAVTLDNGRNAIGQQRNLRGPGGALLAYDLLRGAGGDAPLWDDQPHPLAPEGGDETSVRIAGRLIVSNGVPADGVYTDTVLVRIDY